MRDCRACCVIAGISNEPMPKRPGADKHLPCAGCHAQQFSNADSPLCTDLSHRRKVRGDETLSAPQKFQYEVRSRAPHGQRELRKLSSSARGGVALSIPSGFNAHTNCFRCHTDRAQSGGRDISSCGTCHQLGGYSRTSQFARAFRVGFSHGEHNQVTCNGCHQVRAGMPQRRQVTQPQALNHHATGRGQSCLTCHDGKRAFGGDDFSCLHALSHGSDVAILNLQRPRSDL